MKVGISYAVELDEIPAEVEDLIRDVQWDLFGILEDIITNINDGQLGTALGDIKTVRKNVNRLDTRLEDCYTILIGYVRVLQELEAQRRQAAKPQVTELGPGHTVVTATASEDDINDKWTN